MKHKPLIHCLLSLFTLVAGASLALAASLTTVEFTSSLHFLTPAGENIEVGPGVYRVEAADLWLKLLPENKASSSGLLIEATRGAHEEDVTEPLVKTISNPDTPDVLQVAILMPNGTGLESTGTMTGIRPRAVNLAFVRKRIKNNPRKDKAKALAIRPKITAPRIGGQTQAPPARPKGRPIDCGPFQKVIGKATRHSPALAVYQNALHLVTSNKEPPPSRPQKLLPSGHFREKDELRHWTYSDGRWNGGADIEGQSSKTHVALSTFQNRLHMVHLGMTSNDIWHSTYDGNRWTRNVKIQGQKSKTTPALSVLRNQLHMVHQGDKSNSLWHSINNGNGWTVNVRLRFSSGKAPALGRVPNGPMSGHVHMVFRAGGNIESQSLWHTQYDGRQWKRATMIRGPLTKAAPTLVSSYPAGMHLIHLGKSSNDLWHMVYGPNKKKNNTVEWFDNRRLLSESSKHPVSVALFHGCYHMVSNKGGKLMHTTFSTAQVHPNR